MMSASHETLLMRLLLRFMRVRVQLNASKSFDMRNCSILHVLLFFNVRVDVKARAQCDTERQCSQCISLRRRMCRRLIMYVVTEFNIYFRLMNDVRRMDRWTRALSPTAFYIFHLKSSTNKHARIL